MEIRQGLTATLLGGTKDPQLEILGLDDDGRKVWLLLLPVHMQAILKEWESAKEG